jgi:hypothetical protein
VLQLDAHAKGLADALPHSEQQQREIDHLYGVLEGTANQKERLNDELHQAKMKAKGLVLPPKPEPQILRSEHNKPRKARPRPTS